MEQRRKRKNKQSNVFLLFSLILSTLPFKTIIYYFLNCKYKLIPKSNSSNQYFIKFNYFLLTVIVNCTNDIFAILNFIQTTH